VTQSHRAPVIPVVATLGSAALFGTSATSRALSDLTLDSVTVAAVRLFIGALGLVAISAFSGRGSHLLRLWRQPLIWIMGLGVAGYQALFFVGTGLVGVAIGTLASLALGPLMAGLLAWARGGKRPSTTWWLSTAIAIAGLVALSSTAFSGDVRLDPLGIIAAVGAGTAYAVYTVLGSQLAQADSHPTDVLAASFFLGSLLLLPLGVGHLSQFASATGMALALWLGFATTTLAYVLFGKGIGSLPPGTVATLNLAEPVIATVLGVIVLKESINGMSAVGCALIAASLSLLAASTLRGRS
jgi:DME family drug/metabolite transporter